MPFFAASEAPPRPESMKFPVFSLLAGNLAIFRDEFAADSPSRRESIANLTPADAERPGRSCPQRRSALPPKAARSVRGSTAAKAGALRWRPITMAV